MLTQFNILILTLTLLVSIVVAGPVSLPEPKQNPTWKTLNGDPTIFFAHRGETVLVPGHTLPAYEIAAILQAEYIEPDLVLTKDGVLVCYHDMYLKAGTNIEDHPEFEHLKRNYSGYIGYVYENIVNDYFIENFTLAELQTLQVKQRPSGIRPQYFNTFKIPSFQEYLNIIHRMSITLNKTIGIIPELKHAAFTNREKPNNYMENIFLDVLVQNGYPITETTLQNCTGQPDPNNSSRIVSIPCPPVIIQSFELPAIQYLRSQTDLDLMMLIDPEYVHLTYKGFEEVAKVADWVCVWKEYLYVGVQPELDYLGREYDEELVEELGGFIPATEFITEAHRLDLKLSLFTINDSREGSRRGCAIVPGCEPENKQEELFYYFEMGIDGIFIEGLAESRELRLIYEYEKGGSNNVTTTTMYDQVPSVTQVRV